MIVGALALVAASAAMVASRPLATAQAQTALPAAGQPTALLVAAINFVTSKTGRTEEQAAADMLKDKPIGRLITPEEVAAAALFLCSPGASAITGTTLTIAGGEI